MQGDAFWISQFFHFLLARNTLFTAIIVAGECSTECCRVKHPVCFPDMCRSCRRLFF